MLCYKSAQLEGSKTLHTLRWMFLWSEHHLNVQRRSSGFEKVFGITVILVFTTAVSRWQTDTSQHVTFWQIASEPWFVPLLTVLGIPEYKSLSNFSSFVQRTFTEKFSNNFYHWKKSRRSCQIWLKANFQFVFKY